MFKKKYLLLTLFLIIIFQILLYTNNNQKTSFRYFKWTVQELSIGKLISISFFSGLFVSTLLNTTITTTSFRKKTLLLTFFLIIIFQILIYTNNNQKTSFRYFKWTLQEVSIGKLISISFFSGLFVSTLLNTTMTSTIFRNNISENVEDDFVPQNNEEDIGPGVEMPPQRDVRETHPTISVNYRVVKNMNDNNLKKDQSYSNQDIRDDWDNTDNDW